MHHKLGVRAAHMPIMKGLLLSTLRAAAADLFSASVEAAWGFVW
jgi:hemoglobin-like flavoprotein